MKNLALALLICATITSCATYKRCQNKFATLSTATDSVRITVPVSVLVPRDSVVTTFKTDTTYLYKEIHQGRASVIVERTNTVTTVQARCDTVTIFRNVPVKVPGPAVVWGVKPAYKKWFKNALNLLVLSLAGNIILLLTRKKKKNAVQTTNNSFS